MKRNGQPQGLNRPLWGLLVVLLAAPAWAGEFRDLMEQVLDKPLSVQLRDVSLPEAIETLSEESGLRLRTDPAVWRLLPYGRQTKIESINLKDAPLREGLARLLDPLCMTYRVEDEAVLILPSKPLQRMGRRPTWQELEFLQALQTTPLAKPFPAGPPHWHVRTGAPKQAKADSEAIEKALAAIPSRNTLSWADAIERIADQSGWVWYPWGREIVILPQREHTARLLERLVSLRYSHKPLQQILLDLGRVADVRVGFEPGALAALPPDKRSSFTLYLNNATIRQALEAISGETGLAYELLPEEVRFSLPKPPEEEGVAERPSSGRGRPVGMIAIPFGKDGEELRLLLFENDLSPDLRKRIESSRQRALEKMEKSFPPSPAHPDKP